VKLKGELLDVWFTKNATKPKELGSKIGDEYIAQYNKVASDLQKYVHSETTKGAISIDGGYLTDHGPDHIGTVIARASALVEAESCLLSAYEVYLLLMAIHFHDIGNVFGRANHASNAQEAMKWLGESAGRDEFEKKMILQIARAHGGEIDGDKDTIGKLGVNAPLHNRQVRPRLLAAILRFADELADERRRANRFGLDTKSIPETAAIYHEYALALHSVRIEHEGQTTELAFSVPHDKALRKYKLDGGESYLLDYILKRTLKMYLEQMYCMRYMRNSIALDRIDVRIEVFGDAIDPIETIAYRIAESGYPTVPLEIYELCPDLAKHAAWGDVRVCGESLHSRLSGGTQRD